jgi:DNA helicase IV
VDDPALVEEQEHLDRTWSAYEAVLRALQGGRRSGIDDFANEALDRMRGERLRLYTSSSGPLYFGRIDPAAGGPLYVGRHAIADERNDLLAVNWRAPAAEPFYAATPGDHRGLVRRRRLDVDERRLLGFVDETLSDAEGNAVLTDAIVEDITRRRVGEMRQIVSTITPEQYALISEPVDGALVIQGGPGTGKTAVGLHRAAWLLYADPALARAGVLVVGPNAVFITYISQVLPSLGETTVEQRAIDGLAAAARAAAAPEPRAVATLKGSGRMAELLRRLLWARTALPAEEVRISLVRTGVTVAPDDVARLVALARGQTRSYQRGRERFRERLADWVGTRAIERARALTATHDEVMVAVRASKEFQRLANQAWPRVTGEQLFAMCSKNRKRLAVAADGLLDDDEVDLLLADGAADLKALRRSDVPLLDEARWLVDPDLRTYGHVIVDEAQNLTPMELRMAVRRARGQALTIMGDIAQRTSDAELDSWGGVLDAAGVARSQIKDLAVSYRVPDDFLRVAATVAPEGTVPPRGVREAAWPAVAVRTAPGAAAPAAATVDLARRIGPAVGGSVGVVAPAVHRGALAAALHADAVTDHLSGAVDLLDLQSIKGLEFDAVLVVDPAAILAERPDGGAGGLYTALTRSTRALAIVSEDDLPAALGASPDLHHLAADDGEALAAWLGSPTAAPAAAGSRPAR